MEEKYQKIEEKSDKLIQYTQNKNIPKFLEKVINIVFVPIVLYNTLNITDSELKNGCLENIKRSQTALDILTKQLEKCEPELKTLQKLKSENPESGNDIKSIK